MGTDLKSVLQKYDNDPTRLMDILGDVQSGSRCISDAMVQGIADGVGLSRVDVEQTISFYHFFSKKLRGTYTVYLNNSAVAEMMGRAEVAAAFEGAAGCSFGGVSPEGTIGLFATADIGMNDQEPAALINGVVFPALTPQKARDLVAKMKAGKPVSSMVSDLGDGVNAKIGSMVNNNLRVAGDVHFAEYAVGSAMGKCVTMTPVEVIAEIKKSNLRGRGGAGFPTGMKWEFCAKAQGDEKFVLCNADEGEPGTFKDRVLLTERAAMVFEGMAMAGYAIGSSQGIMYLRGEYAYLLKHLNAVLDDMREKKVLGKSIAGKSGFDFDIRVQLGAGAYVCGEESALIESAEGKRGEPRNRPPFPVEKGYLNKPTTVNNVETFSAATRILVKGANWFNAMGTDKSAGTKVLSISGDCRKPGVYEVAWGLTVNDMLKMAEADSPQAVQVGGPSGTCVGPKDFDKKIGFEQFATGGSIIIVGKQRNLLQLVHNFMEFFTSESCGSCVPCRAGTWIMRNKIKRIMEGAGTRGDLKLLLELGAVMKTSNKCGLGQTAANPVVTTITSLPDVYEKAVSAEGEYIPGFDMAAAVAESCSYVGRTPNL